MIKLEEDDVLQPEAMATEPDADQPKTILDLQQEVLSLVFQHLPVADRFKVAGVCLAFQQAVRHPSLWRNFKVKVRLGSIRQGEVIPFLSARRVNQVSVLSLDGDRLRSLLDDVDTLELLDLSYCRGTPNETLCGAFTKEHPGLTSLLLDKGTSNVTMALVACSLKNLTFLDLQSTRLLGDETLMIIAQCLLRLTHLILGAGKFTTDGFRHLEGTGRPLLQLQHLEFCGNRHTGMALVYLAAGQQSIRSLRLCEFALDDVQMRELIRLAGLTTLELVYSKVNDAGLLVLGRAAACRIEQLALIKCSSFTADGLCELGRLASLRVLRLEACRGVTNVGLAKLVAGMPGIVRLTLDRCSAVTDKGMTHVAALVQLRALRLAGIRRLGNRSLLKLVGGGSRITELVVEDCVGMDGRIVDILADGLPGLRVLDLPERCVGHPSMKVAADRLLELTSFKVGGVEMLGEVRRLRGPLEIAFPVDWS